MSFYRRREDSRSESTAPSVATLFERPAHAGALEAATLRGRAVDGERRIVDLALWLDDSGRVTSARWKASTCVSLIACAERACQLLEGSVQPSALDRDRLLGEVSGLHPTHHLCADLVVEALRRALGPRLSAAS